MIRAVLPTGRSKCSISFHRSETAPLLRMRPLNKSACNSVATSRLSFLTGIYLRVIFFANRILGLLMLLAKLVSDEKFCSLHPSSHRSNITCGWEREAQTREAQPKIQQREET